MQIRRLVILSATFVFILIMLAVVGVVAHYSEGEFFREPVYKELKEVAFFSPELAPFADLKNIEPDVKEKIKKLAYKKHFESDASAVFATSLDDIFTSEDCRFIETVVPHEKIKLFQSELPQLVFSLAKKVSPQLKVPKNLDNSKEPVARKLELEIRREVSYYLCTMSKYFASKKEYEAALASLASIQLLDLQIERASGNMSFDILSYVIAISSKSYFNDALTSILPVIDLPAATLKEWTELFSELYHEITPLKLAVECDKVEFLSIYEEQNQTLLSKLIPVMKAGRDPEMIKKYVDPNYEPILKILDKPFTQEAYSSLVKHLEKIETEIAALEKKLSDTRQSLSLSKQIEQLFLTQVAIYWTFNAPSLKKHAKFAIEKKRQMSGLINTMGLKAYEKEFGCLPESLGKVEECLGFRLPKDPVGEKNFIYNPENKEKTLYGEKIDASNSKIFEDWDYARKDTVFIPLN